MSNLQSRIDRLERAFPPPQPQPEPIDPRVAAAALRAACEAEPTPGWDSQRGPDPGVVKAALEAAERAQASI
jgi:hypothetical protein